MWNGFATVRVRFLIGVDFPPLRCNVLFNRRDSEFVFVTFVAWLPDDVSSATQTPVKYNCHWSAKLINRSRGYRMT